MLKPQWGEDERLGRWVGEVARRWAAAGLSARRRLYLFARLLSGLTRARTTGIIGGCRAHVVVSPHLRRTQPAVSLVHAGDPRIRG